MPDADPDATKPRCASQGSSTPRSILRRWPKAMACAGAPSFAGAPSSIQAK